MTNGFDLNTLSAAKLALIFNAVTTGPHVKKFERTPRALERTLAELAKVGVDAAAAALRAGVLRDAMLRDALPPAVREPGAFEAVNLVTGQVVPLHSLHDPLRRPDGDPKVGAKKAADTAVTALRASRPAAVQPAPPAAPARGPAPAAPVVRTVSVVDLREKGTRENLAVAVRVAAAQAAPVSRTNGPAASNKTLPLVVEALKREGGATLAELTMVAGWREPFELANLRIAAKKLGFRFAHDDGTRDARRYWILNDPR